MNRARPNPSLKQTARRRATPVRTRPVTSSARPHASTLALCLHHEYIGSSTSYYT